MRRGQLLSLDAILSLVMIILILSTVTTTSSALKNEIASLTGWYERTNIPDNMLDMLTKTPGDPVNWTLDPNTVRIVGLKSLDSNALDYNKIKALVNYVEENNSRLIEALYNMSDKKAFMMNFYMTIRNVSANFSVSTSVVSCGANFSVYDVCQITGGQDVILDGPTIVNCTKFRMTGSSNLNVTGPLCVNGSIYRTGSGDIYVDGYLGLEGYFRRTGAGNTIVNGDVYIPEEWKRTASGDINITGNLYIGYYWWMTGSNINIYVEKNVYVFGRTLRLGDIMIDLSGSETPTIGGALYVNVSGTWYAAVYNPFNPSSWYVWDDSSGKWISASSLVTISADTVEIDGIIVIQRSGSGTVNIGPVSPSALLPPPSEFPTPPCFSGNKITLTSISNLKVNVNVIYAPSLPLSEYWASIAVINGTLYTNENTIRKSMENSPWIEYDERRVPVGRIVYNQSYNLTKSSTPFPFEIYSGVAAQHFKDDLLITLGPGNGTFVIVSSFNGPDYSGYSALVLLRRNSTLIWGVNMTKKYSWGNVSGVPDGCVVVPTPNGEGAIVSWDCLIPQPSVGAGIPFTIWAYALDGSPWVSVKDMQNFELVMKPLYDVSVIRVWVWDGS